MTLNEVIAKAAELGPDRQAELHMTCQREGRHGLNATEQQLNALPMLEGGPDDTWRYCPKCFTLFMPDGEPSGVVTEEE